MKKLIVLLTFFICCQSLQPIFAQGKVDWLTWEEAVEKSKANPRKIFVDVYTDWCGWCKRMDKSTFQQKHIADFLNENYYPVKFNAESKEDIEFNGKVYKYVKSGKRGYHELAAEMLRGRLSYPSIVFFDEELNLIQPLPGYQSPEKFEVIATYFGFDNHKKIPWEKYQQNYVPMEDTPQKSNQTIKMVTPASYPVNKKPNKN